ncbi:MAG TPA: CcoQ/FixQ family Cbb3-type cytochrome c oxidase assembly chaperone [Eoetvoesiella sp.]
MALLNGITTLLAMATFFGIVWWACSRGRTQANEEASLLPFSVPDELPVERKAGGSHE